MYFLSFFITYSKDEFMKQQYFTLFFLFSLLAPLHATSANICHKTVANKTDATRNINTNIVTIADQLFVHGIEYSNLSTLANALKSTGLFGTLSHYAMFFGLTAGVGNLATTDYAATIAVKTTVGTGRVPFPQDGPALGIARIDASSFMLPTVGTYEITFRVHTTEPGQLQLELNGVDLAETVAVNMNPTAGGHPIIGNFFITTTTPNSVVAVVNPAGNTPALTITPANGASTHANSQSLTIALIG